MTTNRHPYQETRVIGESPSAHLLQELQLYGGGPSTDEPDPRPLPDANRLKERSPTCSTRWSTLSTPGLNPTYPIYVLAVNLFDRRIERIERVLDANECDQRRSQREQDGSEVRSVELERLVAQGLTSIERRISFEFMRDTAIYLYAVHVSEVWRPRSSSLSAAAPSPPR